MVGTPRDSAPYSQYMNTLERATQGGMSMKKRKKKKTFTVGEKQVAAVKMIVDGDYKIQEVAYALGVHRTTVWRWFKHKEMERYFWRYEEKQMRKKFREIERQSEKGMEELQKKLDSPNPWEANAAANAILNRYGDWLREWLKG